MDVHPASTAMQSATAIASGGTGVAKGMAMARHTSVASVLLENIQPADTTRAKTVLRVNSWIITAGPTPVRAARLENINPTLEAHRACDV